MSHANTPRDWVRRAPQHGAVERIEAYFAGHGYDPHRHDTYAIGQTLAGVQSFRYRRSQRHSLPGGCLVLHPDELHDGEAGSQEGFRYRMLYVEPALIQQALGGRPLPFVRGGLSDDPPLLRRLRAEAPGIVLVVRRANYLLMPNLLASGEISVGVSYTDELPANAKRKTVRRSKPKILRADSAPGQLTLDDYCARPHALVSFAGDLSGFVDEELEKFGRKRKVVLAVPQFNGLGTLLAGTDIIATVPDYAAQALIAAGGLRAEDPPFETRAFELSMAWRGAQDNDPAERWLRSRISMFIGDPDSL